MSAAGRLKAAGWGKPEGLWSFGGGPVRKHAATGAELRGYTMSVFHRGRRRYRRGYELWMRDSASEHETHRFVRCADTMRELVTLHAAMVQADALLGGGGATTAPGAKR